MSHHTHRRKTRTAGLATAGALVLALSACGSSSGSGDDDAAASEPSYDTARVAAGADWLAAQVEDGVVHNDQYDVDDQGLAVDVALALQAVGEHDDTVQAVVDHLTKNLDAYVAPGFGTLTSAGSAAKAAVLVQATDGNSADVAGTDLVGLLEERVADEGPAQGRVEDEIDPKQDGAADYANTIAQSYAVQALGAAGSDEAGAATAYLLSQQCSAGWFRLAFAAPEAKAQGCDDDAESTPDIDATAFAVRALAGSDDEDAQAAVGRAVDWLEETQAPDGSLGGDPVGKTPNSNSTGLVGWVLGDLDETGAAEQAATWVADHQLTACGDAPGSAVGAVAYDDTALASVGAKGITTKSQDQFRRAGSQAVPALQWLPAGSAGGDC